MTAPVTDRKPDDNALLWQEGSGQEHSSVYRERQTRRREADICLSVDGIFDTVDGGTKGPHFGDQSCSCRCFKRRTFFAHDYLFVCPYILLLIWVGGAQLAVCSVKNHFERCNEGSATTEKFHSCFMSSNEVRTRFLAFRDPTGRHEMCGRHILGTQLASSASKPLMDGILFDYAASTI
jgi:hypothetical protein